MLQGPSQGSWPYTSSHGSRIAASQSEASERSRLRSGTCNARCRPDVPSKSSGSATDSRCHVRRSEHRSFEESTCCCTAPSSSFLQNDSCLRLTEVLGFRKLVVAICLVLAGNQLVKETVFFCLTVSITLYLLTMFM